MGGKQNMGALTTLALVIVLTQSRAFDFLTESPLGRLILLACIIFIAYTSKLFGLLAVLFIIIAYNQYGMNVVRGFSFSEGFKNDTDKVSKIKGKKPKIDLSKIKKPTDADITTTSSSAATSGREGFCMSDRESMMLRGKPSNTIPVFGNAREQDDDVSPSDNSMFVSDFSSV